jgi:hypothetical protein
LAKKKLPQLDPTSFRLQRSGPATRVFQHVDAVADDIELGGTPAQGRAPPERIAGVQLQVGLRRL